MQIDTDGRTSFDIALEAKDSGALALLFKALTDERVHALFRGCFVENVCKVLRQYPLAVEVLGPAFESVKTETTIFSKEKEITRAHLRHTELCGHAERCGKSAESVWRNRDANGTVWPPAAVINAGSKDTLALGDQSSAEDDGNDVVITSKSPWQDDTNGVVVVSKCFDVPGVVNIELLQLLQENANNMSSTCRQQIFTSPVVEAALELLWEEHAKKCWFRELVLYLCFLATLVVFSLSVNSTFHDGHDADVSIVFQITYLTVTLATGAFGCYLGAVEYSDFRMIIARAQKLGVENVTWEFVSDKMGMSNMVDIAVAALAVVCSASALIFVPGPFLVSMLSLEVLLSVINL